MANNSRCSVTFFSALSGQQVSSKSWIEDSGVTNHMTGDAKIFNKFEPCKKNYKKKK